MTTSRTPTNAVDHVGSLKRPPALMQTWRDWEAGKVGFDVLREVQDRAIRDTAAMQEQLGLPVITDGEFRRGGWSRGFLSAVEGFDFRASKLKFRNEEGFSTPSPAPIATKPIRRTRPIVVEDFNFLKGATTKRVKVTMPTPSHMHFGQFKDAVDRGVYPDLEQYWSDLIAVFRDEIDELYAAGCRFLQLDEVPLALLCDPNVRALAKQEGDDPDQLVARYVAVLNRAIAGRPSDMTIAMHVCRGNMESLWMGDGGYAPVAEALFALCDVDAYLLEYDSPRAGDFAPLRHLPAGKRAYLGIISTKNPSIESSDDLMRRLDEAAKYAPMARLGICPQCGFASAAMSKFAVMPSKVTTDVQTLKLERLVEVGHRAWGHA
jgi:5-methyltetrahydropteroyltriglutamate--homocysteine methyltransferase